jgi:hypothetical protein
VRREAGVRKKAGGGHPGLTSGVRRKCVSRRFPMVHPVLKPDATAFAKTEPGVQALGFTTTAVDSQQKKEAPVTRA